MAVIVIIGHSCKKNSLALDSTEDEVSKVKTALVKLGFDTASAIIKGEDIFVEGDILLKKSELFKTQSRHATAFSGGPFVIYENPIKFYVSPVLGNSSVITEALNEFSAIKNPYKDTNLPPFLNPSLGITFTEVFNENEANLIFHDFFENSIRLGYAQWPNVLPAENLPPPYVNHARLQTGKNMYFNTFHWSGLSISQKKFLVAHEFGHALGLRHTDWRRSEASAMNIDGVLIGAYTVPNTPNSTTNPDPNSLFNSGAGTTPFFWNGFTIYDKVAIWFVAGGGASAL
ncbi:hypothetical protein GCM10017764_08110 [Sphingobacterium griseoflavum]|uniref:Peptidase M10 metallopeptidase domain-containing protein n=2 Tax=Sphingobacterium griseoflavum TaxID=1474952 RepID=A0ABQ3HU09_9SPHI|nr:hypothetical protein GCM10017764_08110 [Sphingobacterium griseoflavum]